MICDLIRSHLVIYVEHKVWSNQITKCDLFFVISFCDFFPRDWYFIKRDSKNHVSRVKINHMWLKAIISEIFQGKNSSWNAWRIYNSPKMTIHQIERDRFLIEKGPKIYSSPKLFCPVSDFPEVVQYISYDSYCLIQRTPILPKISYLGARVFDKTRLWVSPLNFPRDFLPIFAVARCSTPCRDFSCHGEIFLARARFSRRGEKWRDISPYLR